MGWDRIGNEPCQRWTQTHLAIRCRLTDPEDRMGCGGGKLRRRCWIVQHLEWIEGGEEEKEMT